MAITTGQDLETAFFLHGENGPGLAKAFNMVLNRHPSNASLTLPEAIYTKPAAMKALLNAMDRHGPDDNIKMDPRWLGQVGLVTAMHAKRNAQIFSENPAPELVAALGILTDAMHFSTVTVPEKQVNPRNKTWDALQIGFDSIFASFAKANNWQLNTDFKLAPPPATVEVKPGAGTGLLVGTAGRGTPVNVRCR